MNKRWKMLICSLAVVLLPAFLAAMWLPSTPLVIFASILVGVLYVAAVVVGFKTIQSMEDQKPTTEIEDQTCV